MTLPKNLHQIGLVSVDEFLHNRMYLELANRLRHQVYQRDGYRCLKCGISSELIIIWQQVNKKGQVTKGKHADASLGGRRILTLDHVIPRSFGGGKTLENLDTLCDKCNHKKGNMLDFSDPRIRQWMTHKLILSV